MATVDLVILLNTDEHENITVGPATYNPADVSIRVSSGQVLICTREQARKLYRALNAHLYAHHTGVCTDVEPHNGMAEVQP